MFDTVYPARQFTGTGLLGDAGVPAGVLHRPKPLLSVSPPAENLPKHEMYLSPVFVKAPAHKHATSPGSRYGRRRVAAVAAATIPAPVCILPRSTTSLTMQRWHSWASTASGMLLAVAAVAASKAASITRSAEATRLLGPSGFGVRSLRPLVLQLATRAEGCASRTSKRSHHKAKQCRRNLVSKAKVHAARVKRTLLLFSDRENLIPS